MGQWVSNDVLVRRLQDGALLGSFAIPCGQARSLVAGRLAGHLFLFTGTSEGAVIYHHIKAWYYIRNACLAHVLCVSLDVQSSCLSKHAFTLKLKEDRTFTVT